MKKTNDDKEYGFYKFKIPSKSECSEAMGLSGESTLLKKILQNKIDEFFSPIQIPKNDNDSWLLTHKETGQTYNEFMRNKSYYPIISEKQKVIYLINLNFLSSNDDTKDDITILREKMNNNKKYQEKIKKEQQESQRIKKSMNKSNINVFSSYNTIPIFNEKNYKSLYQPESFLKTYSKNYKVYADTMKTENKKSIYNFINENNKEETVNENAKTFTIENKSKLDEVNINSDIKSSTNYNFGKKENSPKKSLFDNKKEELNVSFNPENSEKFDQIDSNVNTNKVNVPKQSQISNQFLESLFLPFIKNYFHGMQVELKSINICLNEIIYKKSDKNDALLSVDMESLINYLNIYTYSLKNKSYCIVYLSNIQLFQDKYKLTDKKYIIKTFPNTNNYFEVSNIKERYSLLSFSAFDVFKNSKISKDKICFDIQNNLKLIIRNILLLFGLNNCIFYNCILNGFGNIRELYFLPIQICPVCLRKLYAVILKSKQDLIDNKNITNVYDIIERYKNIHIFLKKIKDENNEKENNYVSSEVINNENNKNDEYEFNDLIGCYVKLFENEINWYCKRSESFNIFNNK